MAEVSLQSKLCEFLREAPVDITDGSCGYSGTLAPGSVRNIALQVMSIVRAHDEKRARGAWVTVEELTKVLAGKNILTREGRWDTPANPCSLADELVRAVRSAGAEVLDAGPDDVVDAHICCEHASTGDREVLAMAEVLRVLAPLRPDECSRVLDWARRRYAVDVPF